MSHMYLEKQTEQGTKEKQKQKQKQKQQEKGNENIHLLSVAGTEMSYESHGNSSNLIGEPLTGTIRSN